MADKVFTYLDAHYLDTPIDVMVTDISKDLGVSELCANEMICLYGMLHTARTLI